MKYIFLGMASAVLIVSAALATDALCDQIKPSPLTNPVKQEYADEDQAPPVSAEGQAEVKRREFVDRLTELKDRDSDLDKQAVGLRQDLEDSQNQLLQTRLELKRVRIDQKDVQRNIKELAREEGIFHKKDEARKKIDRLQSAN